MTVAIVELRSIGSPAGKVIGAVGRIVTVGIGFYPEVTRVFSLKVGVVVAVLVVTTRGIRYFNCRSLLSISE